MHHFIAEVCTSAHFLLQNGASWYIRLMHSGILWDWTMARDGYGSDLNSRASYEVFFVCFFSQMVVI